MFDLAIIGDSILDVWISARERDDGVIQALEEPGGGKFGGGQAVTQLANRLPGVHAEFQTSDYKSRKFRYFEVSADGSFNVLARIDWDRESGELASPRVANVSAVLVYDYHKGLIRENTLQLIRDRAGPDVPIIVNPSRHKSPSCYRGATLVVPNEATLRAWRNWSGNLLTDVQSTDTVWMDHMASVLQSHYGYDLIVTRDRNGAVGFLDGREFWAWPSGPSPIRDVTGASDVFVLAFAYHRYGLQQPPDTALKSAVDIATWSCSVQGVPLEPWPLAK